MIAIRDLSYTYPHGQSPALRHVDWAINDGEFVLLAGRSGSGKSTLLRCLNGLVPHFTGGVLGGTVVVDGIDVVSAGPRRLSRLVGFVAQDPEAQAVLDQVEREVAFALENAAIPPDDMRARVEEALALVELTPLRDRALSTLSGGERQRLTIAAALALRPRVLVLDEPTSQLDPQSAADVLRALVRLNKELGLTIVLAEHRLERVLRYADRLTYLEAGQIVVDGTVRQALAQLDDAGIDVAPPLVKVARALGWQPLPLTVTEGQAFAAQVAAAPPRPPSPQPAAVVPVLEIEGLRFAYHGRPALNGVELTIGAGEAVALVGRNGAGKSTLLKCIVGLLAAQAGEVRVAGRSTRGRSVADLCRAIGYLPQNPDDLLFAETVADELRTTLRNHRLPESAGEIAALLRELGLDGFHDVYPRDLSVGQRQRVALGAVTVTRPRLLLLDEPTRGLDGATKAALVAIWRRWLAGGAAILLVTHDVELAATIATRTVVLSEGKVIATGATSAVLGGSSPFAPQIARLFPGRDWLTPEDVVDNVAANVAANVALTRGQARHNGNDMENNDAPIDQNLYAPG
ncbi:putative ABC transporter ATP-binding protein SAV_5847 [Candidatus Promineifilum breve]|uniref:ABC transporter ATP-binding protein SAV_5847 n=1 Tax=Candidatus Promineifilum breve TaxID=1806508 RepID=A0A160SYB4_9CHLR|nr:ATP-binding cassette domain-containing protein [Candidatus Promineifilum breve]CUS02256.2 putative ABC transporter ATP-binding protein SAV_5847 [Candidatus Promineifilum breve]